MASGASGIISALDSDAASWYSAVTGTIVAAPNGTAGQYAALAATNQIQTQAALAQANPTLAGLLNNPTVVLLLGLGFVLVVVLLFVKF